MTTTPAPPAAATAPVRRRGRPPVATLLAGAVVALLLVVALAPQLFSPHDPEHADLAAVFAPPGGAHPAGTDQLGRDVLSRVVHGSRTSLAIGLGAAALSLVLGVVVGVLGVYLPFGLDRVVQRAVDVLLAFPDLLLALVVVAVLGRGPVNTLVAVGISGAATYARVVRSQLLVARASGYAEHARVLGESPARVVLAHVLPNTARPLAVLATLGVGTSILSASGLSFLGLGVVPPTPEWGALLAEGRSYLSVAPWSSLVPATAVAVSVVSATVVGRHLQSRLTDGGAS